MNIFSGNHTVLYNYIPKEILPIEYGGNAPSMIELNSKYEATY